MTNPKDGKSRKSAHAAPPRPLSPEKQACTTRKQSAGSTQGPASRAYRTILPKSPRAEAVDPYPNAILDPCRPTYPDPSWNPDAPLAYIVPELLQWWFPSSSDNLMPHLPSQDATQPPAHVVAGGLRNSASDERNESVQPTSEYGKGSEGIQYLTTGPSYQHMSGPASVPSTILASTRRPNKRPAPIDATSMGEIQTKKRLRVDEGETAEPATQAADGYMAEQTIQPVIQLSKNNLDHEGQEKLGGQAKEPAMEPAMEQEQAQKDVTGGLLSPFPDKTAFPASVPLEQKRNKRPVPVDIESRREAGRNKRLRIITEQQPMEDASMSGNRQVPMPKAMPLSGYPTPQSSFSAESLGSYNFNAALAAGFGEPRVSPVATPEEGELNNFAEPNLGRGNDEPPGSEQPFAPRLPQNTTVIEDKDGDDEIIASTIPPAGISFKKAEHLLPSSSRNPLSPSTALLAACKTGATIINLTPTIPSTGPSPASIATPNIPRMPDPHPPTLSPAPTLETPGPKRRTRKQGPKKPPKSRGYDENGLPDFPKLTPSPNAKPKRKYARKKDKGGDGAND
ncbi:hypothetical protein K490DRAFT_57480 [Saccharata proteae CBS 121410]|uniref:Uncharacterized protein n=1 Tax=Saccharata proteae CBS 121410 TaxID=1314787 RepID=A0A9P4HUK3_9PEZI|nr:hypothetical protein K490DRAFT_57480 [Saccharata proteae CBS 121410]